jgi:hypothetical protein
MLRTIFAASLTVAVLAGCTDATTYEMPADKVRGKLLSMSPPMMVFGGSGARSMTTQPTANSVRWTIFGRNTKAVMSLVATVEPKGETQAAVSVTAEPPQNNNRSNQAMADNPQIVKLYRDAMREQIDAKLTGRQFDMSKISGQLMAATVATMPKMVKQVDEAAKDFKEMEREADAARADAEHRREQRETMRKVDGTDPLAPTGGY